MADVKQTIQDFYRVAQERDFARDFQFRVISLQTGGASEVSLNEDDLVYLKSATLPGRTITNTAVNYMGLDFNIPGSATYGGTYALSFWSDKDSKLRQLWETWTRDVFDDADSTGNYFTPKDTAVLDMVQLDAQLNRVAQYQLVGIYPQDVGELSYDMAGTGAPLDFLPKASMTFSLEGKPALVRVVLGLPASSVRTDGFLGLGSVNASILPLISVREAPRSLI